MEDLRSMHRKNVAGLAEESTKREDLYRKAKATDTSQRQLQNDERFDKLSDDYVTQLRAKERLYQAFMKPVESGTEEDWVGALEIE